MRVSGDSSKDEGSATSSGAILAIRREAISSTSPYCVLRDGVKLHGRSPSVAERSRMRARARRPRPHPEPITSACSLTSLVIVSPNYSTWVSGPGRPPLAGALAFGGAVTITVPAAPYKPFMIPLHRPHGHQIRHCVGWCGGSESTTMSPSQTGHTSSEARPDQVARSAASTDSIPRAFVTSTLMRHDLRSRGQ